MTSLRSALSLIRTRPIVRFEGRPEDIPCIETSDSERLCKHPLVSVAMITYNHEAFIRQAIDGVMMQKVDFDFELVIGEDCSTDRTREICLEYQRRYPRHIRVLWSEENVHKVNGNWRRVGCRCRGKLIAYCEGDDYWIDPLKLQKQADLFRVHDTLGICIAGAKIYNQKLGTYSDYQINAFPHGYISGRDFLRIHGYQNDDANFIMTASVMVRADILRTAQQRYDIFNWGLSLCDTTTWHGVATLGDAYVLYDTVSVYRRVPTGATATNGSLTDMDGTLVRIYFAVKYLGLPIAAVIACFADTFAIDILHLAKNLSASEQRACARSIISNPLARSVFSSPFSWPGFIVMRLGWLNDYVAKRLGQVVYHLGRWRRRRVEHRFIKRYF